jgi:hypothetical protein
VYRVPVLYLLALVHFADYIANAVLVGLVMAKKRGLSIHTGVVYQAVYYQFIIQK